MSDHRVAIIGAGLAGLTAASTLLANRSLEANDLLVLETNAEVGGRLATESVDGVVFDHGAQFFTVRSEQFRHQVNTWLADGAAVEWCQGFSVVDGYPRYRGAEGMTSLALHLADALQAQGVTIVTSAPASLSAASLSAGAGVSGASGAAAGGAGASGEQLSLSWAGPDGGEATADALLLTPPIPESRALLAASGLALDAAALATLAGVDYHRVLAVLAVLDARPGFAEPGAYQQPDDPTFSFVAESQAKGISDRPGITFHTSHQRSAELWASDDAQVLTALRPEIERYTGSAGIQRLLVRRWRYSGPVNAVAEPFLEVASSPGAVLLAGDGFGGSKVEGAFTSGAAAADRLTEILDDLPK